MANLPDILDPIRPDSHRFTVIDAFRGLAALSVVLFHAGEGGHITELLTRLPDWVGWAIKHGELGVAVFFVLSGFVIAHSLHDKPMTAEVFGRFTLRRSMRLDPPYWATILLCIGFAVVASRVVKGRPIETYSLQQIAAHAFYLQDILGFPQINTVFWTLCLEIQFYLAYAALLVLGRNDPSEHILGRRTAILLIAVGAISLLWPLGIGPDLPPGVFLPFWHGFLLGVGAYWSWKQRKFAPWFLGYATAVSFGAIAHNSNFSIACASTALVLYALAAAGRLHVSLNWRWLQFLGLISYSLYLTHGLITGATFRAGYMLTGRSIHTEAIWWPVSIMGCIIFATIMWWIVERPSIAWSRKVKLTAPNAPSWSGIKRARAERDRKLVEPA